MKSAAPGARPWLPEGALTSPRAAAAIGAVVGGWARHWFDGPGLRAAARWTPVPEEGAGWAPPRPLSPYLAVQGRNDAAGFIGQTMTGLAPGRAPQPANDRQLLDTVGASVLADLDDRLARFFDDLDHSVAEQGAVPAEPRLCLAIEDAAGRPVHRLLADTHVVIALVRQGIDKRKIAAALAPRGEAVADQRIGCGVLLGRAHLPYLDVCGLAVGDVLILGTEADVARDLLIDGQVAARAAVRIPGAGNAPLSQQGQSG